MSLAKDSYDTTIGSLYNTRNIQDALRKAIILDEGKLPTFGVRPEGNIKPFFVTGLPSHREVPIFYHPIDVDYRGQRYVCMDVRFFMPKDGHDGRTVEGVSNRTEFNFAVQRTVLSMVWANGEYSRIKNTLFFANQVYSTWLSEVIGRSFNLDFADQSKVAIVCSLFYQGLFEETFVLDEETKNRCAAHTIKAVNAPADMVFETFDKIEKLNRLPDLVEAIKAATENVRLKDFNLKYLTSAIQNSWFGQNNKEVVSVALEHPPTWCVIVFSALNERTYQNSMIGRTAKNVSRRGAGADYIKAYEEMVIKHSSSSESVKDTPELSWESLGTL